MIVLDSDHITNTHGAKDYLLSTSQGRMQKHPKNQMPPAGFHVDEHFDYRELSFLRSWPHSSDLAVGSGTLRAVVSNRRNLRHDT